MNSPIKPSPARQLMAGAPPFPPQCRVTLDNWQDPPFNRWAFQHVRELIPAARVARGDGPVRRLPHAKRDITGISFRSGERELTVGQMLEETYTDGFMVLHRGQVTAEEYFNGLTPQTPHLLMSISKSVTGAVAGKLWGRGILDVSSSVTDVVPELRGTSFDGATVRHLLDMRAGTRFSEDYEDPGADVRISEPVYLWRPRGGNDMPGDALTYFTTLGNDGPHGGPFRYRSILTDVLAWVIEKAAGNRFHELLARELWQPMGAECDAEITLDAHGNPMADGGICATLPDLARFGLLYLHSAQSAQAEIIPRAWISDTITGAPDGAHAFTEGDGALGYPAGAHYRNCWWVLDPAQPFLCASGINGQHLFLHGPSQTVIAKLSSWPMALHPGLRRLTLDAVAALTVSG